LTVLLSKRFSFSEGGEDELTAGTVLEGCNEEKGAECPEGQICNILGNPLSVGDSEYILALKKLPGPLFLAL
jgi:hypothetical protein